MSSPTWTKFFIIFL